VKEMIERSAKSAVKEWLSNGKDAFLLTGARQIGKTYLIRQCLKENEYPYLELNFIEQPELIEIFSGAKNAKELLMRLSLVARKTLEKGKTIIFLDEIQEFKDIVTRIKFLVEEGSFRYIMSGSLLGVELNDLRSAPVGYMRIYDMYPLGFKEFARAVGIGTDILELLENNFKNRILVDDYVHTKMLDVFYLYLIIGGMPEAVDTYVKTNDLAKVAQVHEKIIRLYKKDFSKYEVRYKLKLREIYDAMPGQLDQKNKRFQLNSIEKGISYDRVANDFLWLKDAGVVIPVYNVSEPKLPLVINENRNLFKLFFSDVGLLTSCYSNQVKISILNKDKSINNGALFENVVAQELLTKGHREYYFNSKKQGELDFVVELDGKAVPLEIKSGKDYKRHSALNNVLKNADYNISEAYIFSEGNIEVNDKRIYMPIYMIMFLDNTKLDNTIYRLDIAGLGSLGSGL
jgi:predicted AAA+ superfamily ATPase